MYVYKIGLVWEEDSPATNGWLNVRTTARIRKDGNFVNFAAGQGVYKHIVHACI